MRPRQGRNWHGQRLLGESRSEAASRNYIPSLAAVRTPVFIPSKRRSTCDRLLVAASVSSRRRQEADSRCDGLAGQSQLAATPGKTRSRPTSAGQDRRLTGRLLRVIPTKEQQPSAVPLPLAHTCAKRNSAKFGDASRSGIKVWGIPQFWLFWMVLCMNGSARGIGHQPGNLQRRYQASSSLDGGAPASGGEGLRWQRHPVS